MSAEKQILYVVEDVARLFRVDKVTVYNWIKNKGIQTIRVGRRHYFLQNHINQLLKERVS